MLFNSLPFLVFFAIVYPTYLVLPHRWQNRLLLVAGYVFYGWWDVRFLFLLAFSTGLDFCCGLMLGTGVVPAKDRLRVSAFLLAAAVAFTVPDWQALSLAATTEASTSAWFSPVAWDRVVPASARAWYITIATAAALLAANLAYAGLVRLPKTRRQQALIVLTVMLNLGFLGIFKYFNFFIESADALLRSLGLEAEQLYLHVVLPVGISFYTFASMSYTIDVYRGKFEPVRRLEDYATYVSFFLRWLPARSSALTHLVPQLVRSRRPDRTSVTDGLYLILLGFFKKVAIADGVAASVTSVFGSPGTPGCGDVWAATLLFTVQIYCDFSGYTDIARGITKLLGMDLALNFNLPYVSRSPSEFWSRWHISLSTWLRDYLYIPLGGNRQGPVRTYRNLLTTMLLGGLWHGAAWNYVLWGLYHGLILCGYRASTQTGSKSHPRLRGWYSAWAPGALFRIHLLRLDALSRRIVAPGRRVHQDHVYGCGGVGPESDSAQAAGGRRGTDVNRL